MTASTSVVPVAMKSQLRTRTVSTETGWSIEAVVLEEATGRVLGRALTCVLSRFPDATSGETSTADYLECAERDTAALAIKRAQEDSGAGPCVEARPQHPQHSDGLTPPRW